jgi:hypothetical protein
MKKIYRSAEVEMNVNGDTPSPLDPLSWCHSAHVETDPSEDTVTMVVRMVGGRQYLMSLWCTEDGRVFLRVPAPSEPIPADGPVGSNTNTYEISRRPVVAP